MPLTRSLDRLEQLANVNTASLQDGSVLRYDLAAARYVVASVLTATAVGVVVAGTLTVTGAVVFGDGVNAGNLVAANLTLNTLTVTGTTQLKGATNLGACVLPTLTASSVTVTGAMQVLGATNLGTTVLPGLTANTLTVTGTAQIRGSTNLGDLTAGVTQCNSLTVTGATALATLTATQINNSGAYGGNGTAFTLARSTITLPDASDYTLSATERASLLLDVQASAGASGATNLIAPGSAGGLYLLLNRSGQTITLKTAGNTGIAVATTRIALICFPGGTTGFRVTPDTVYTS